MFVFIHLLTSSFNNNIEKLSSKVHFNENLIIIIINKQKSYKK